MRRRIGKDPASEGHLTSAEGAESRGGREREGGRGSLLPSAPFAEISSSGKMVAQGKCRGRQAQGPAEGKDCPEGRLCPLKSTSHSNPGKTSLAAAGMSQPLVCLRGLGAPLALGPAWWCFIYRFRVLSSCFRHPERIGYVPISQMRNEHSKRIVLLKKT